MSDTAHAAAAASRSRSFTWSDPHDLAKAVREHSGLDFLRKLGTGELAAAPFSAATGVIPIEVSEGRVVFALDPQEWHYNPIGSVHGGFLATLADTALACSVHSRLPAGTGYTSLDLTIKFTRAATIESGRLICEAQTVSFGRRTATAEARITDATGR